MKAGFFLATSAILVLASMMARPARAAESGRAESATTESSDQARAAFRRGVELYEERDFGGAGVEFRRAYQLAKSFRLLYNLGRVAVEEHDYASALDLFARYLAEGGGQVPPDRGREVREEMSGLWGRVAKLDIVADGAPATLFIDDVEKGRTPLKEPVIVNVGRRHVELRPKSGAPLIRWVDAPGGEVVVVRFAQNTPPASAFENPFAAVPVSSTQATAPSPTPRRSHSLWLPWTATGLCAAGVVVAGAIAYRSSQDLSNLRQSYPVTKAQLDDKERTTRIASLTADGLAGATALLAALSLYLTLDNGSTTHATNPPRATVGMAWPGVLTLDGRF